MLDQITTTQSKGVLPINGAKLCTPEEPVYPVEFLSVIKDTGFEALQELLKSIDAPQEALGLLEDLAILTTIGEVKDGEFGGVGLVMKHAFAAEESAGVDAVESADEFFVAPDFDAVGDAFAMKRGVRGDDGGSDPGARQFDHQFRPGRGQRLSRLAARADQRQWQLHGQHDPTGLRSVPFRRQLRLHG